MAEDKLIKDFDGLLVEQLEEAKALIQTWLNSLDPEFSEEKEIHLAFQKLVDDLIREPQQLDKLAVKRKLLSALGFVVDQPAGILEPETYIRKFSDLSSLGARLKEALIFFAFEQQLVVEKKLRYKKLFSIETDDGQVPEADTNRLIALLENSALQIYLAMYRKAARQVPLAMQRDLSRSLVQAQIEDGIKSDEWQKAQKKCDELKRRQEEIGEELSWQQEYMLHKLEHIGHQTMELTSQIEGNAYLINFVEIRENFQRMYANNKNARAFRLIALLLVTIFMLGVPVLSGWLNYDYLNTFFSSLLATGQLADGWKEQLRWERGYLALPMLVVELLFVYIFRVLLRQYQLIETQMTQLDIRYSLLPYIEYYFNLKLGRNDLNPDALGGLENLLIGLITGDFKQFPQTLDGLAEVLKQARAFVAGSERKPGGS